MPLQNPIIQAVFTLQTTVSPSISCIQWSSEGQLIVTTKGAVYILTPEAGVAVHQDTAVKSAYTEDDLSRDGVPALGLLRNVIEFDRAIVHHWPVHTTDWAASSMGALDVAVQTVAVYPTDAISNTKPAVAVLNTNMELTLWRPAKDFLRGEWLKVEDITTTLVEWAGRDEEKQLRTTLRAQACAIAWSMQPDFGVLPLPPVDGSVLAIGNKFGYVLCCRLIETPEKSCIHQIGSVVPGLAHITALAWSPWKNIKSGLCQAWLACAGSEGSVNLVRVTQTLDNHMADDGAIAEPAISTELELDPSAVNEDDGRGITALHWVVTETEGRLLLICKPGLIQLMPCDEDRFSWSGLKTLSLDACDITFDSSIFHPISGIERVSGSDTLILSVFDGSIHVLDNISTLPEFMQSESENGMSTETLSTHARTANVKAETREQKTSIAITRHDANRVGGMTIYDKGATVAWLHEFSRPSDFSYKHDAKHISRLVLAQLWEQNLDDHVLHQLQSTIQATGGGSPLAALRPVFHHLRNKNLVVELAPRILEILRSSLNNTFMEVVAPPINENADPANGQAYRRSLVTHLFGWPALRTLRVSLAVSTFMPNRLARAHELVQEFASATSQLTEAITRLLLHVLLQHLLSAIPILAVEDVSFAMRIGLQAMLSSSHEGLSGAGQNVLAILNQRTTADKPSSHEEQCPACNLDIQFADALQAECSNGHIWPRCSITSFIMSTTMVRTCSGCARKAFQSPSNVALGSSAFLPRIAQGWFVQELLEAATRCLYCGNNFVTLV